MNQGIIAALYVAAVVIGVGIALYSIGFKKALRATGKFLMSGPEHAAISQVEVEDGIFVGRPPQETLDLLTHLIVEMGYVAGFRTPGRATFVQRRRANTLAGIILTFFFLVPGILYFLLAERTKLITVVTQPELDGTRIYVSANSRASRDILYWAKQRLASHPRAYI